MAADQARVYSRLADYSPSRLKWLPDNYSDLTLKPDAGKSGTEATYRLKVGPRERVYNMMITEPIPGTSIQEKDGTSSMTVTWEVAPLGAGSRVTVTSQWNGAGGIGGFFERTFAPRG